MFSHFVRIFLFISCDSKIHEYDFVNVVTEGEPHSFHTMLSQWNLSNICFYIWYDLYSLCFSFLMPYRNTKVWNSIDTWLCKARARKIVVGKAPSIAFSLFHSHTHTNTHTFFLSLPWAATNTPHHLIFIRFIWVNFAEIYVACSHGECCRSDRSVCDICETTKMQNTKSTKTGNKSHKSGKQIDRIMHIAKCKIAEIK